MFFCGLKNKIFGCIFGDKRCRIGEENGADSVKKRGHLRCSLRGKQHRQQILHLREHEKAEADAQLLRLLHLAFQSLAVVKEDEAGVAAVPVGKIAGTEGAAEIDGPALGHRRGAAGLP